MWRSLFHLLALIVLALGIGATAAAQGMYWESRSDDGKDNTDVSRLYFMPKMFKEVNPGAHSITILRLDKEILYEFNTEEKTYTQHTFAELEAMAKKAAAQMKEGMARMKEQLDKMPPEQRKVMEEQLTLIQPEKPASIDVVATGERATISGFASTKTVFRRNGKEEMTFWVTHDIKEFSSFKGDFYEFLRRTMGMNPLAKQFADAISKLDGFPVQIETAGHHKETVTKFERRTLSVSEFEVPSGYTLQEKESGDEGE